MSIRFVIGGQAVGERK